MKTNTFTLTSIDGRIVGADTESHNAFEKFKATIIKGEVVKVKSQRIRSPKHHRFYFALMDVVFKQNSLFTDSYACRKWIEMQAGHFHQGVAGGVIQKIPKSIAYEQMEQGDFYQLHQDVIRTLATESVAEILFHESNSPLDTALVILGEFK